MGKCAKQTTVAVIITRDGEVIVGTNWCKNPQGKCPREGRATGEGYELCRDICGQDNHAEVDACIRAGNKARGGRLYLCGHYYFCDSCLKIMTLYGIENKYLCSQEVMELGL